VVALITCDGAPARVSDDVLEAIRVREVRGAVELPRPRLKAGVRVRILQGSFAGQVGLLGALRPHERCVVLLNSLGRTTLPEGDVEAVG
jgi:transcription antitermination factor NusG